MKKLNALLFNQGGKCFYCDAILDMNEATLDHVIPQSKGGKNDLDNLVVCCKYANHAFRDYSPKHKMAVIKELCCLSSVCKKIFPREEEIIESKEVEEPQIELQPEKKKQDSKAKTTQNQLQPEKKTQDSKAKKTTKPNISIANQLLLKAIAAFEKEGKEGVSSQIKNKMLELNPAFKEADYGFNQFNKFLLHAQEQKVVTLKKQGKGSSYVIKKKP
ncbi:MAG: hypothetical protein DRR16_24130 [Candidatus Parabeggiatoa sp. nov. 3]|nr:MAG: hypothetical protein DRR00_06455 [Gammaproteobacteria bacterium]RKZ64628.1 MAG: hypothetical protein DRQ99_15195 [Gammaproteobacteria bacterium]RKZ80280.1 MAG: hypothetical protein DRR16_24130 [Gammaproteobacteria bacterium]